MTENNVRAAGQPHPRTLLRWAGRLLALAFAALVIGALAVLVVIPRAVHGQAMTVLTGSMTPTIPVGSTVLVRPVDPGTLHVGDIATYQKTPGKAVYITHRIVKIDTRTTPTRFTFKGDANRGPDIDPVLAQQIRGQVWFHVPYLGAIRDGLHGKGGPTLLVALLLAGYAISQVGAGLRERREGASPPATPRCTLTRSRLRPEVSPRGRPRCSQDLAAPRRRRHRAPRRRARRDGVATGAPGHPSRTAHVSRRRRLLTACSGLAALVLGGALVSGTASTYAGSPTSPRPTPGPRPGSGRRIHPRSAAR